jgi:capsular exopolysaccharide synthesis family protein
MLEDERRETAYKQSHKLVQPTVQQDAVVSEYIKRDQEVSNAQQELASAIAKRDTLAARLKDANETIAKGEGVRDDTQVLNVQAQLKAAQIELANAKLKYTAEYPGVIPELEAKINDLQSRLTTAVRNTLDNKIPSLQSQGQVAEEYKQAQSMVTIDDTRLKSAMALRDQLKGQTASIPQTSMEFAQLSRQSEMSRQIYQQLQTALSATRLDKDMAAGNVQVAQLPYAPEQPFLPNRTRDLIFGTVIGLFLSMLSVLLLEQGDKRVRDLESVRRLAPGPVVGALPQMSRRQLRGMLDGEMDPTAIEAYSLARANLSLAHRQSGEHSLWGRQVVLITSAVPGEGKSLTAFQMARSIARSGRSVILVDADMRRPTQNRMFNTDEPYGLADILMGEMTLDDALVSSDIDTLHVLHSGTSNRNPTDLVSTQKMADVISELREEADVVIIDTPACSVVADALLLAPHADCILHVIGAGQVDEALVNDTAAALRAASPKTLAFFVNRAPRERRGSYHNYYYYAPQGEGVMTRKPALPEVDSDAGPSDSVA